jgi:hypothetical protein
MVDAPITPPPPTTTDAPTTDGPPPARGARHRARRTVSMVLVVLAAIMIPVATTAVWATRTMLNTGRFTATVSAALDDPGVISAASARITDEVFDALANSQVVERLPSSLQPVAPIIGGALRSRIEVRVNDVLSAPKTQQLLTNAVRRAHAAALKVLEGKGLLSSDAFTVENGTVTLNLLPVIRQVLIRLQDDGVIPASVNIPAEGEPPGKLATALGAKLPADFGKVVVYQTKSVSKIRTLDQAQHALVVLKRAVVLLVILALVLAAAAVLVAVDHRRALYRVGLGVTIGAVVLIVVTRRVAVAVPRAASTRGGRAVSSALAQSLRSSLVRALLILALVAAVTALIARTWVGLAAWTGAHADLARFVVVGLGLIILLVLGLSWGSVIFAAVVIVLGLVAVQRARDQAAPAATSS